MTERTIGRYHIKSKLGEGSMGIVVLAYDPQVKREVALKVLHRHLAGDAIVRQRFLREARVIAQLGHSAIVPVYDVDEADGYSYFVMRYMEGGSLLDLVRRGPLPSDAIVPILNRVGAALDAAHAHGIVHRDVKPDNILFDQYGQAYLSDFGIVRAMEGGTHLTKDGLIGTPAYMSPEQVTGDESVDGASDLYSLGAVLFEMITGELPYEGDTSMQMATQHVLKPVPRLRDRNPNLPKSWERIIARAMAKKKQDRYQTGADLAAAFAAAKNGDSVSTQLLQRRWLVPAAVIILMLLFLAWGAFGLLFQRDATRTAVQYDAPALEIQGNNTAQPFITSEVIATQLARSVPYAEETRQQDALFATETQEAAAYATRAVAQTIAAYTPTPSPTPLPTPIPRPAYAPGQIGFTYIPGESDNEPMIVQERVEMAANTGLLGVQINDAPAEDEDDASFYLSEGSRLVFDRASSGIIEIILYEGSTIFTEAGRYNGGIEVELEPDRDHFLRFDGCVSIAYPVDEPEVVFSCYDGVCEFDTEQGRSGNLMLLAAGEQLLLGRAAPYEAQVRRIPVAQAVADARFISQSGFGLEDAAACLQRYLPAPTSVPPTPTISVPTITPRPTNTPSLPTPTNTPTPRPATSTPTPTPRPATSTPTPRPATSTPTPTPRPATSTPTPRPATSTPTPTPRPATSTPTATPGPATNTPPPSPTNTPVTPSPTTTPTPLPTTTPTPLPTTTPTPLPTTTPTPLPTTTPTPLPTDTPVPPTDTPVPPTPTITPTPLPPP